MKVCPKCGKQFPDEANFCPVDAARLLAAAEAVAPGSSGRTDLIGGRFEIGERLGGSTTGDVYRALDHQGGGTCAVKLVAASVTAVPAIAQRAERELKQLERVASPQIARVLASGKNGGDQLWVATELVEGGLPLTSVIGANGPMDASDASAIVVAIGEALIEAAKVGVVHRDLAPKNVLVVGDSIKLINFCVPVPISDKVPGVPEFVAPDVIEGRPVDQRSNIYSLGALYYYLLTGETPYIGVDAASIHQAHLTGQLVPPAQRAQVPADVDGLVVKALERNNAKRYLNLRQFLDEVARVAQGPEGGVGSTAPFGRAGAIDSGGGKNKKKDVAATLMGIGSQNDAKTKQMEVAIPAEALREVAALDQAQAAHAAQQAAQAQPGPGSPWAPPAGAPGQVGPAGALAAAAHAVDVAAPQIGAMGQPHAAQTAIMGGQGVVPAAPHVATLPGGHGAIHAVAHAPAAPQVAAPVVAGPGGKKKPVVEDKKMSKGKFRETMWFKKGELDVAAAEAAAEERQRTGQDAATDKADSLPMEERYTDDGSLTRNDAEKYSLRTGATAMMAAMPDPSGADQSKVSERELIGEMKGGSKTLIIVIVVAVIVIGVLIAVLAL